MKVTQRQSSFIQFKTIFNNNFLLAARSRELITEIIFPLVISILIMIKSILTGISFLASVLVPLAINGSTRSLLIRLVEEKSGRYKETMKIMGLRQTPYFMAWYTSSLIRTYIGAFVFLIFPLAIYSSPPILTWGGDSGYTQTDYITQFGFWEILSGERGKFVLLYFLYVLAAVHQAFCLSTLFSSPKLAGEVGTFFTTMITLTTFLGYYGKFVQTSAGFIILGIFPQTCMGFGYMVSSQTGFYPNYKQIGTYTIDDALIQMSILVVVYLVLYFYLEEVLPNEYGVAKHPLFFIKNLFKKEQRVNDSRLLNSQLRENSGLQDNLLNQDIEQFEQHDTSSALYHEPYAGSKDKKKTVQIQRLAKYFGSLKAVNGVSLSLYEKNIFCLLGHNGAGKTTMISVLTGLISKTLGNVKIYDQDLEEDLDEIRNNIGICNQRDVLYEELTFEEHLRFMARIKGVQEDRLDEQIELMIEKTKCQKDRKKTVKSLSGGNKRKLSLANALIGGSQIVFLDEPSSGMDAISRRKIWDILEQIRSEERTIVLTTHHLDEAEVLADRIGIMAKGKLLAVGTSEFIKKNFGVGYHLKVFPNPETATKINEVIDEQTKNQIVSIVQEELPTSTLNPQSRKDTLSFQLPYTQKSESKFSTLFHRLEEIPGIMINLEINSLEDAFINIGMEEERFMDKNNKSTISIKDARKSFGSDTNKVEAKYTKFDDIYVPQCVSRPPTYSFSSQFTACFLRKYYVTTRTFTNYVAFFIPLVLLIGGAVIVYIIQKGNYNDFDAGTRLIVFALFAALAYCFNGSIYVVLPVQEREDKLKYALNVMGCRILPYWFATFAFDYIVFLITIIVFVIAVSIGQIGYITKYLGEIFGILAVFGLSYVPFSYMCGFLFKKANSSVKMYPLFNFIAVFNLPFTLIGITSLLYQKEVISEGVFTAMGAIFSVVSYIISPFFTMQWAIDLVDENNRQSVKGNDGFYLMIKDCWPYVLIMVVQGILYMSVAILLEQKQFNLQSEPSKQQQLEYEYAEEIKQVDDDFVLQEKQRVAQLNNQKQSQNLDDSNPVIVEKLWKQYENGFVAIKDVSYATQKGEIFGLLGPNGSGKSTSFNILTTLIPKTVGSVKIKNLEVNKGIMDIYQDVGICPQFDCIWPTLNPVEHLYLFGRMKGLKGKDLDEAVQYFIQIMQLSDHVKTQAGRLSGGNKRKLCVSDALIGGPDIQFFDEPSTGVDPIARRFLWNTLQQGAKLRDSSIIMTTHTMEEAESLCTKIGILINGQFYCIGTPADLRHKYGEGYTLSLKIRNDNQHQEVFSRIQQCFPSVQELKDKREHQYIYRVRGNEFKFGPSFELCEQMKAEGIVEEFSINQSSLEEVFIHFSKFQKDNDEEDDDDENQIKDQQNQQQIPVKSNNRDISLQPA